MIDPERWRQIDALLVAALEREPAERLPFLKEASPGDDSLRMEVESLLASSEHALSLIDTPAFEVAAGLLATHIPELAEGESSWQLQNSFIPRRWWYGGSVSCRGPET